VRCRLVWAYNGESAASITRKEPSILSKRTLLGSGREGIGGGGPKDLAALFGRLHVLGPDLEHVLEAERGVGQAALQHHDEVVVVLVDGLLGAGLLEGLELPDLLVERGNVPLDDVGQLRDLDRPVVEERLLLGHCCARRFSTHAFRPEW
jgi:hypothetical protein